MDVRNSQSKGVEKMGKWKITKFFLIVFFILSVAGLFGQSTLISIRFLNCEWGISPEEAIISLREEIPDIDLKENTQLKDEDKKTGMREFETESFLFANYKWRLKLIFLDNKLANVILSSSKANKLKVIEELEAKFGKYEVDLTKSEIWEAIDGSQLSLRIFDLSSKKVISVSYYAPGFWGEYQKRKR
jgi:hypothetical protein